jgi:outer membrane protein assembly factor BamA
MFIRACLRTFILVTFGVAALDRPVFAQQAPDTLPKGWVVVATPGFLPEPSLLHNLMRGTDNLTSADLEPRDGLYPDLGNMASGAGFISLGVGYRHHVFDNNALVDVAATSSRKLYQVYRGSFEFGHLASNRLTIGAEGSYQDLRQMAYFGVGDNTPFSNESAYRFRNTDIAGYATWRPMPAVSVLGRVGWVNRPTLEDPEGPALTVPSTFQLFTEATAPGLTAQPSYVHADGTLLVNLTDHIGHPTSGGVYRASVADYSDQDSGIDSFRRYDVEAAQYVPVLSPKWVLAAHTWAVFSDVPAGNELPFYLMPTLGGGNTLRGYTNYRFRDRDLLLFNLESRWSLMQHVDLALFADAGNVADRASALSIHDLKQSYGVGLRLHNANATLARIDVGHSTEGWQVYFKLNESFKRSTPAIGRMGVIPFVP